MESTGDIEGLLRDWGRFPNNGESEGNKMEDDMDTGILKALIGRM